MKLQELIGQTDLDMNLAHIKAFFLGVMSADRPLPFHKAMQELLAETPEATGTLEKELKVLWDELEKNKPAALQKLFPESGDIKDYLTDAKDQLDFFLTAMSLSGTNTESCKNEDVADLIDELEDTVMDLEDFLSDPALEEDEAVEFKETLLETWQEFLKVSKQ
jgi:hypothetical protein